MRSASKFFNGVLRLLLISGAFFIVNSIKVNLVFSKESNQTKYENVAKQGYILEKLDSSTVEDISHFKIPLRSRKASEAAGAADKQRRLEELLKLEPIDRVKPLKLKDIPIQPNVTEALDKAYKLNKEKWDITGVAFVLVDEYQIVQKVEIIKSSSSEVIDLTQVYFGPGAFVPQFAPAQPGKYRWESIAFSIPQFYLR